MDNHDESKKLKVQARTTVIYVRQLTARDVFVRNAHMQRTPALHRYGRDSSLKNLVSQFCTVQLVQQVLDLLSSPG